MHVQSVDDAISQTVTNANIPTKGKGTRNISLNKNANISATKSCAKHSNRSLSSSIPSSHQTHNTVAMKLDM